MSEAYTFVQALQGRRAEPDPGEHRRRRAEQSLDGRPGTHAVRVLVDGSQRLHRCADGHRRCGPATLTTLGRVETTDDTATGAINTYTGTPVDTTGERHTERLIGGPERSRGVTRESSHHRRADTDRPDKAAGCESWVAPCSDGPLPSSAQQHERLTKTAAIGAFGLDALSSVAYGPDEILYVLLLAGTAGVAFDLPIAAAIALLLAVVVISYRQTIHAYPNGGGSFTVASRNLGRTAGLVAAGALMVDYLTTVAVSVTAGVAALIAFAPAHQLRIAW